MQDTHWFRHCARYWGCHGELDAFYAHHIRPFWYFFPLRTTELAMTLGHCAQGTLPSIYSQDVFLQVQTSLTFLFLAIYAEVLACLIPSLVKLQTLGIVPLSIMLQGQNSPFLSLFALFPLHFDDFLKRQKQLQKMYFSQIL